MTLSNLLLGLSDLGLLLAVVGVYVFFAALWLIYSVTERSEWGSPRQERRVEQLRRNNLREIEHNQQRLLGGYDSDDEASYDDAVSASSEEVEQLRIELANVREISVASATQIESLLQEIDELRADAEYHVAEFHAELTDEVETDEETPATIKIYDPDAMIESATVEQTVAEPTVSEQTAVDPERGLVYTQRPDTIDDLTRIWGVGKVNQDVMNEHGVYRFEQIAAWNEGHINKFNDILCFRGRIEREDWVGQAARLTNSEAARLTSSDQSQRHAA